MRRFFRTLAKDLRRPGRPVSARPALECLEDRTVPSTLAVTKTLDDANVQGTLRYAIAHAQGGDTIQLMSNQLNGPINLAKGELLLNKDLTISASDANLKASISGQHLSRVFEVAQYVTVSLTNLVIKDGSADASINGGGIYNWGTLTVSGCTLSGNTAYSFGGGIYNEGSGTLTVSSSTLSGNSAGSGGGIYDHFGTLTVSGGTLSDNSASDNGGGIYDAGGTVKIGLSTLSGNKANRGGGIYNSYGTLTVSGGNLHDNTATLDGGGIYNNQGSTYVKAFIVPFLAKSLVLRSALATNHADPGHGGGIYNDHAYLSVSDTDLLGNSAYYGGGVYNIGFNDYYATNYNLQVSVSVSGSTLSGNHANYGGGIYSDDDGSIHVSGSSLTGNTADKHGGGIYNSRYGSVHVSGSTLSGNTSYLGGGIYNLGWIMVDNKSTVSGNAATRGADLFEVMSAGASVWIALDSTVAVIYTA